MHVITSEKVPATLKSCVLQQNMISLKMGYKVTYGCEALMRNLNRQLISILCAVLIFSGTNVYAQGAATPAPGTTPAPPADSELSLEDELNQAQTPQQSTVPTSSEPIPAEATMQTPVEPTANVSNADIITNEDVPLETDQAFAMNGWSFGVTAFIHNYNVDASMLVDDGVPNSDGVKVDLSSKSNDFQSLGVVGRYAILPLNKFGTDLNITLGNSINHGSVNFSSITTLRAEINIAYTVDFGKTNALYYLVGGGYEVIYGQDINRIIVPGGGLFQIGAGITFNKKLSLEGFYSYASHRVSDRYLNDAKNAVAVATDSSESANKVTSNVIQGRLMYNY